MTYRLLSGILYKVMPAKKPTLKSAAPEIGKMIMNLPLQTLGSKVVYVVLLFAFLAIGYLYAKVEVLQGGGVVAGAKDAGPVPSAAPQAAAPQEPAAPDPEQVKKDLKMGHFPVKGNDNAKVTIVEFSDFECPFCGRFYKETLPQIVKDYIDTGKAKLYYRHYPLAFHPKATPLAHASECANDQGAFWKMHDKIFENNATVSAMTDDQIKQWAVDLGLDAATFNNCYDNKIHQDKIDEDQKAGTAVGVSGTPTFYINGKQLVGAMPFDSFKAVIDEELK